MYLLLPTYSSFIFHLLMKKRRTLLTRCTLVLNLQKIHIKITHLSVDDYEEMNFFNLFMYRNLLS